MHWNSMLIRPDEQEGARTLETLERHMYNSYREIDTPAKSKGPVTSLKTLGAWGSAACWTFLSEVKLGTVPCISSIQDRTQHWAGFLGF